MPVFCKPEGVRPGLLLLPANYGQHSMTPDTDPLLQPLQIRHLSLRNRIMSTSHSPAYAVGGEMGVVAVFDAAE